MLMIPLLLLYLVNIIISGKVSNATVKKMKGAMIHAEKYFNKWKIEINQKKTQAIIFPFNKSPKRIPLTIFNIQGTLIPMVQNDKYLGIFFDKRLTFKHHILQCGRALYSLLNTKSHLNTKKNSYTNHVFGL